MNTIRIGYKTSYGKKMERDSYVYTPSEAEQKGIVYKYWRDVSIEKGDYVITDDEFVVEVLAVSKRRNKKGEWVQLIVRTPIQTAYADAKFKNKLTTKEVSSSVFMNGDRFRSESKRGLTSQQKEFAILVASGIDPYMACKRAYNVQSGKNTKQMLSRLLSNDKIQEMIVGLMQKSLVEVGINESFLAEKLKDIIEDDNPRDRLPAVMFAGKLLEQNSKQLDKPVCADFTEVKEGVPTDSNLRVLASGGK